jgi:hypothetical protein
MLLEVKYPALILVVAELEKYFKKLRMSYDRGTIVKPEAMAIQFAVCSILRILQNTELGESKSMVLQKLHSFEHSRFKSFKFHERLLECIDYLEREVPQ